MSNLIEIKNLSKSFSSHIEPALEGIDASIPKGKIVGLIGPDGAGKTTLMRLMAGLLLPTKGSIHIEGKDTQSDTEDIHYLTGYMPQKFGLYEDLTVMQNLNLYADLKGVLGKERQERIEMLLEFSDLKSFTNRLARALSGGMKQKLGLACALLKKPHLLLLDEPSVGVDPLSRRELWKMIAMLLKDGISIIWSTAYLDEAEKCDIVLLLNGGKLLYVGNPFMLTQKMEGRVFKIKDGSEKRKTLQQILQHENVMDGIIQGEDVRVIFKKGQSISLKGWTFEPTLPRFEDAFIDILGGGYKGTSELAKRRPFITDKSKMVISVSELTKKFSNFVAVDRISCEIKRGEIFGLLGPNGAGKSTTFKMLCGLLRPTEGKASVLGVDLLIAPGKARAHIGYMAQKFSLYGNLTVLQNLTFFSGIYNLSGARQKEVIHEMIEIFYLEPYLQMAAELLPLGFKQRLSLACATMHQPEILFLDEPTSGVDPITRREFWNHINGLVEKGVTIMVTTHFMDEAEYCDRIALVYRGKIIHTETPDNLKEMAKSPQMPEPHLGDAFIHLIEKYDVHNHFK